MLLIQCPHPLAFCLLICSPLPSISVCPAQSQVEDHVSQLDSGVSVRLGLHSSCEAAGQICHSCSIPLSSDWSQWLQSGLDKQSYAHKISKIRTLQGKKSSSCTQMYHSHRICGSVCEWMSNRKLRNGTEEKHKPFAPLNHSRQWPAFNIHIHDINNMNTEQVYCRYLPCSVWLFTGKHSSFLRV